MSLRARIIFAGIIGTLLALVLGFEIADQNYGLSFIITLLAAWVVIEWFAGPTPDAFILGVLLVGYVVGNRGFAQLSLSAQLPLLPAETGLLLLIPLALLRLARGTASPIRRDSLNLAVGAWILSGTARLPFDLRTFGFLAARDYATIYYAAFFFVAQGIGTHPPSVTFLRRALTLAFILLPLGFLLFNARPEWLLAVAFRGRPLIFYKDDLVAAYFFGGFFFFLSSNRQSSLPARYAGAVALYGGAFLINSSRAAIMGMLATCGWWLRARRWAPWRLQAIIIPVSLLALALVTVVRDEDFYNSRIYSLYEHAVSITDFSGRGSYTHEDQRFVGDNNRFRIVWWRSVVGETWHVNPWFGLGFGYDLAENFVRTYDLDLGDEFSTRSPHSILFTAIGRMGIAGCLALLFLAGAMTRRTALLAARARADMVYLPSLGWASVAWTLFGSAFFGVVLEGPMGAVIFWSSLGLANAAIPAESPTKEDDAGSERGSAQNILVGRGEDRTRSQARV